MKRLICNIDMFSMKQYLTIGDIEFGGAKFERVGEYDSIPELMTALEAAIDQYDITDITFVGNTAYNEKLGDDLYKKYCTKFANRNIFISYVE